MNQEKINMHVVRDFGETFNASVKFIRQNFKLFFKSMILIAGPFLVISSIAGAFYQLNAIGMQSRLRSGMFGSDPWEMLADQFGWTYFIFIIAAIIANLALVGTVYAFMIEYSEKGPGNFTVNDVSARLLKNSGGIIGVFLALSLLFIAIFIVAIVVLAVIGAAVPFLGVLFAIGAIFGMLILFPPFIWQLSVVYIVKMEDGGGPLACFNKTKEVMRGNFWWTWVIVVCTSFGVGIIGIVFTLPQIAYQMVLTFSALRGEEVGASIPFIIIATICTFCTTLLYSLMYVVNGVHYYSLAEKLDGKGLIQQINDIGTSNPTDYQPR